MQYTLTDGFGHYYRPDRDRVRDALERGIVVLDTNVLLNVLRYSPGARKELLDVIGELADRCFIPHQIAVEYNRNRVKVVADRHDELEAASNDINEIIKSIRALSSLLTNRQILTAPGIDALDASAKDFYAALESAKNEAGEKYDLNPDHMVGQVDEWTEKLQTILTGRVAEKPSEDDLAKDHDEGLRRKEARLAPGFRDSEPGDYLWWAEVLRNADLPGRPLVIVSYDAAKGDWRFEQRGIAVGPHTILSEDVLSAGGTDLVLMTTRDLLERIGQENPEKISEETLEESEKALTDRQSNWTYEAYTELLSRLTDSGYLDRAEAISLAASQSGFASRLDIYRVMGVEEDAKSLRHFATPALSVLASLFEEGLVSANVTPPLVANYDGPGKTIGYSVPPEFVEFVGRASR